MLAVSVAPALESILFLWVNLGKLFCKIVVHVLIYNTICFQHSDDLVEAVGCNLQTQKRIDWGQVTFLELIKFYY